MVCALGWGRYAVVRNDFAAHPFICSCENLIVIDLSAKCIEACKERFDADSNITYYVNDGTSLEMIADDSIDFVFCYDSLVHAEDKVIKGYINQLARKLTRNGVGFIHHSNIGEYAAYFSRIRKIPRGVGVLNRLGLIEYKTHDRAFSMTAEKFKGFAEEAGMQCTSQEIINWDTKRLIDCYSAFTKEGSRRAKPTEIIRNDKFTKEMAYMLRLSKLYGATAFR